MRTGLLLLSLAFSACAGQPVPAPGPRCESPWDDAALNAWLKEHRESLILVVSDGMPYSQKSVDIVAAEAARRKLALRIVSDRTGPAQQRRCDPLLRSNTLVSRGALRHFPTLFVVREHALSPKVIPGIQDRPELTLTLDEQFR